MPQPQTWNRRVEGEQTRKLQLDSSISKSPCPWPQGASGKEPFGMPKTSMRGEAQWDTSLEFGRGTGRSWDPGQIVSFFYKGDSDEVVTIH